MKFRLKAIDRVLNQNLYLKLYLKRGLAMRVPHIFESEERKAHATYQITDAGRRFLATDPEGIG